MKNRVYSKLSKIIAQTLVVAMIATAGLGIATKEVKATETTLTDSNPTTDNVQTGVIYSTEKIAVAEYRGTTNTAPTNPGYLFGGWYSDKNEDSALTAKDIQADTQAYAKWVPAQVLGVKTQITCNHEGSDAEGHDVTADCTNVTIRLVSSVDNLKYQSIGFTITMGEKSWETTEQYKTKVYENYVAGSETVKASNIFGSASNYFFSKGIQKIPGVAEFAKSFFATPHWVTLDGTKVEGLAKYVHVEDYYKNYITVPVYLNSANVEAAAGILSLKYNTAAMEYVDCENGTLYEEGLAAEQSTKGTVKCVANVKDISKDKPVYGMFINLRFQLKDAAITAAANAKFGYKFDVKAEASDFCNVKEVLISELDQTINACDIYY